MAQCLPPDICYLCLSRDRKDFCLSANFNDLFGFLTNWYPQSDARVCWECRAMLERLRRFKEQAKQAVCTLERARTGLQPMSFESLSKVYCTQVLFIDLLECDDDANATDDFSICKVEFEDDELEIKGEIAKEDLSENNIHENVPDHIAEDGNDDGSKCFVTIDLTEDNIDYATESDTKQINVSKTELQIVAPSSSAEGEITTKIVNIKAIKKRQGVVKPQIKRKKPIVRRNRRKLNTAEQLIDKERRAEEMKYELYQKGKAFECDHCGQKFERRGRILSHMRASHYKKLMCEQCAYRCSNPSRLKSHMLAHLDPSHRQHECEVCNKRFINKYKLLVHTRSHTGERPFKCDNCDMAFTCKEALTCHVKERHTDGATSVKRKFSQPRTKSFYVNPPHSQSNDSEVSRHQRSYKVIKCDENVTYECNVCKEIFPHLKTFYKHYDSTHKIIPEFQCAECDKTYKWKLQLTRHMSIVHRGERPYECNVCGATFPSKSALQVHIFTHSNEKRYKCSECSATFKSKSGLWGHKLIHKGDKPHQCDICEARFTFKGNLTGHMKVHTNDRPFECEICGKKFPWKRNLKNHLKTHSKKLK